MKINDALNTSWYKEDGKRSYGSKVLRMKLTKDDNSYDYSHDQVDKKQTTKQTVTRFTVESRGSFHKAILATIDLNYLQLILRLPAVIFPSVQQNNFKTIAHVKIIV